MPIQPRLDLGLERDQPQLDRPVSRGGRDADLDQLEPPPDAAFDHAETAPGQPRVDAEYAHRSRHAPPSTTHS